MKNIFKISSLLLLLSALVFWGCKKDDVEPTLSPIGIEDNDLIQVTNDRTYVPVMISASDNKGISSIAIKIIPDGKTDAVASNTLKSITNTDLNSFTVNVPFPLPAVAPNGKYTVEYAIEDTKGNKATKSYKINVLNTQTKTISPCVFPTEALPGGKNVWLQVTVPENTNGDDVFISGNFEGTLGGCSDWSGGSCAALKLTKVSNTCYKIALNLTDASEFKITRGNWDKRMQNASGQDVDNLKWNGQSTQTYTVGNWLDRVVLPPISLPSDAIITGKITIVASISNISGDSKYYLVKKGATSLTGAIQLIRVTGADKMAAAVPKETNAEYIVVKDVITKTGANSFGFDLVTKIDGVTNPTNTTIGGFKGDFTPEEVPTVLYVTGDGAPDNWTNSPSDAQKFVNKGNGKFEIASLALTADKSIKFLPQFGNWNPQISQATVATDKLSGTIKKEWDPASIPTPSVGGNYKIEVDFSTATYKLTKL